MATRKSSPKKSAKKSTKKATKKTAKKSSKKSVKKSSKRDSLIVSPVTGGSQATIPPPNLNCILACTKQFRSCWNKGVDRELCIKRLQRCILACMGIRNIDDGGGLVPDIE